METQILNSLHSVLKQFGNKYYTGSYLNKSKVIEDIDKYDEELILAMLNAPLIKKHYFKKIDEYTIFETNKLIETFEMNDYWMDSLTKYTKRIGLTSNGKFLDESSDIVLDFPYKDTILKAGMTKEDIEKDDLKPDEPFYNEVIASEEIDIMLDKKILINAKRYDVEGEHEITNFDDKDNLIIKGNNLLALHTLKDKYAGKVKLIYIDPPYNTGNDSFMYNDRFNHSTWLNFIYNRLSIANELLSEVGSIWLNIDDDESHYLKVLCDELFGRENFIGNIIWEKKFSPQNDATFFSDMHDHILVYCKNIDKFKINLLARTEKMNERYKNPDNDPRGPWSSSDLTVRTYSKEYDYPIETPSGKIINPPKGRCWRTSKENLSKLISQNRIWFGESGDNVPRLKRFLTDVKQGLTPGTIWKHQEVSHNQEARKEISRLFEDTEYDFSTPKPEKLLQRIIHIGSNEGDLVLDFFMGSATTQAVAMKMNRRFIGIEQMDYINTVSVPRLQKVIEGEQGGISKAVDWHGGGSFIYTELMEKSQGYINQIYKAIDSESLFKIYNLMLKNVDINFKVDLQELEDILEKEPLLDEQKKLLLKVIDKNQLYYNYSEIDDVNVRDLISDTDYSFNQSFYKEDDFIG